MARSIGRKIGLVVAGCAVLSFSFRLTLSLIDSEDRSENPEVSLADIPQRNEDSSARNAYASSLRDLPPAASAGQLFHTAWDGIVGLNARVIEPAPFAGGDLALSLVATRSAGNHRIGMQFVGVPVDRALRAVAWVKVPQGERIYIDVRDGRQSGGSVTGAVAFDPNAGSVLSSSGSVQGAIEPASRDWIKLIVQGSSTDGVLVVYVTLLGPGGASVFGGDGQHMMFGGIESWPRG